LICEQPRLLQPRGSGAAGFESHNVDVPAQKVGNQTAFAARCFAGRFRNT
jgi:hypothetical protein